MTSSESALIVELRKDMARYHEEVVRHIAICDSCRQQVAEHDADINGRAGNGQSRGLKGNVNDLWHSRQTVRRNFRYVWSALTGVAVIVGAVLKKVL